jgi:hypothetical protein
MYVRGLYLSFDSIRCRRGCWLKGTLGAGEGFCISESGTGKVTKKRWNKEQSRKQGNGAEQGGLSWGVRNVS